MVEMEKIKHVTILAKSKQSARSTLRAHQLDSDINTKLNKMTPDSMQMDFILPASLIGWRPGRRARLLSDQGRA